MMHMHLMLNEKQLNVFHNRFKQSSNIKQYLASKFKKDVVVSSISVDY